MRTHTITAHAPHFPPAYVSNGLIGLRVGPIPLLGGTALVNGFVGAQETERIEGYAPAPYPLSGDLCVNGLWLSQRPDLAVFRRQSYDFARGELTSLFEFSHAGATAHVEVLTLCSRQMPTLAWQRVTVEVDRDCKLVLRGILDGSGLPGRCLSRQVPDPGWLVADGSLEWESRAGLARCGAAVIHDYQGEGSPQRKKNFWGYQSALTTDYAVDAKAGRKYLLRQLGSLVPSLMHAEPERQAIRLVRLAWDWDFETLREANAQAWAELWRGRVKLVGASQHWQDVADAAYFYLHTSVHRSAVASVAPFGLGQWRSYHGHVFWDTETYIFPPVLLTAPDAARAMLDYRSRLLPAARNNAALHGYLGAQFPWESGTHGGEVMAGWAAGIFAEQHISLDVAFAFAQYAHATGDLAFARGQAWPVLEAVAQWVVSRVSKTARGYEILHVEGIDEGRYNINNSGHTNALATVVLREAAALAKRLGHPVPAAWERVRSGMVIPIDPDGGHVLKSDGFKYEGGPLMPEPLVALFPQTWSPDTPTYDATVRYYLKHAHTIMNMPFVPSLMGVFAARAGDRKLAAELFTAGIVPFVVEPFMQFTECAVDPRQPPSPHVTPFITNTGSFLMACIYGLGGLELDDAEPRSWFKHAPAMPECWDAVEIDRIFVRGQEAAFSARHRQPRATLTDL